MRKFKILYVAKHNSGDNDDEGAIHHVLTSLGHEVVRIQETFKHVKQSHPASIEGVDFCLFHKWNDPTAFKQVKCPKVFWYFDMVDSGPLDPSLKARSQIRVEWMKHFAPRCVAGFCTDGDWVERFNDDSRLPNRLVQLSQGMDERYVKPLPDHSPKMDGGFPFDFPILFTGTITHGNRRERWVKEMQWEFNDLFHTKGCGHPGTRVHHEALRAVLDRTNIVVAPDGPHTDKYWSNRVYLLTGYGGFLLHPYCLELERDYPDGALETYRDFGELKTQIRYYLDNLEQRNVMREKTYNRTVSHNLYRHRIVKLLEVVGERI